MPAGDMVEQQRLLKESREIWDTNAEAWDAKIGGGGGWQTKVIAPVAEQMLGIQPGERVLDVACGNGLFSRRLAQLGAFVVASDFSPRMIEFARSRTTEHADRIEYRVADATDEDQLLALGREAEQQFDAAICINAIMDMPAVEPLYRAVAKMLRPGGRFVFSIMHPCFNGQDVAMQAEIAGYDLNPVHSIKVSSYLTAETTQGLAITEQPRRQYYWHRPLHELFNPAFAAGLLLDRIEEPRIASDAPSSNPLDWANFDMPPLLFARLRKPS